MNLIATSSARGTRIHRETCKKAKNTQALETLSEAEFEEAFGASCCKPPAGAVQEALAAAEHIAIHGPESAPVAETAPEASPESAPSAATPEEVEAYDEDVAEDPEYDGAEGDIVTEDITADGVPKYFSRWALRGGVVLAETVGIQAERTKNTLVLTGSAYSVDRFQETLFAAWEASYAAFKDWRKPLDFYEGDKKVRWDTEVAFLEEFHHGVSWAIRGVGQADDATDGMLAGYAWAIAEL